jgi:glycosyltransferase involved in cell wall biosynthesis
VSGAVGGSVDFAVPAGLDDPQRVSGGNVVDRQVRDGLSRLGWSVRMHEIDVDAAARVGPVFTGPAEDAVLLIDGLVATRWPEALEAAADGRAVVVLAHMVSAAFADADQAVVDAECRALRSADRAIVVSRWTGDELVRREVLPPERVVVVTPGTDDAAAGPGSPSGCALLCVGVIAPHKGQDTLIDALAALGADTRWSCTIAGSLTAFPDFADRLSRRAEEAGIGDRVTLTGVLDEQELEKAYQRADLLVAPSRTESYGLAIADALRRGIPVIASRVGGIPGTVADRAAILVPPDDSRAWSESLGRWMADPDLRARMKRDALNGRDTMPRWSDAVARVAETLAGVR